MAATAVSGPFPFIAVDAAGNNYVIKADLSCAVPVSGADATVLETAGWPVLAISPTLVSSIRSAR